MNDPSDNQTTDSRRALRADLWLLLLTLIWGASFPMVKIALRDISPILLIAVRFWIAAAALWVVYHRQLRSVDRKAVVNGLLIGVVLWIGFAFQTVGLKYTTASKSGFLTGTLVVMVPIIVTIIERRLPRPTAALGVLFAFAGIYLMTDPGGGEINFGDILTILCAVSFAFQVVMLQNLTRRYPFAVIGFYQILTTAVLSVPACLLLEQPWVRPTWTLTAVVLATALLATALALMIQAGKQRETSAVNAAIIYTGEPIFAAIFSFIVLGEMFTMSGYIGGGLILVGMVIAEIHRGINHGKN